VLMSWHVARHRRSCNDVASERRALNGKKKGGTLGVYRFLMMCSCMEHGGQEQQALTELPEKADQGFGERTEKERAVVAKIFEKLAEGALREAYGDRKKFSLETAETKRRFLDFLKENFDSNNALSEKLRGIFEGAEGEKDLELLTLIRLYGSSHTADPHYEELFQHSLGVFRIGAEVFSDVLTLEAGGGKAFIDIGGRIRTEMNRGTTEDAELDFLRVCLIHDCGKITIPESVTYNSVSHKESREEIQKSMEGHGRLSLDDIDTVFCRLANVNVETFPVSMQRDERGKALPKSFSDTERKEILLWIERNEDRMMQVSPSMPVGVLMEMDIEKQKTLGKGIVEETVVAEGALRGGKETAKECLISLGIDPRSPLGAVIDQHELRSGVLVGILDHDALSKKLIVENHHNKDDSRYHTFASGHVNGYMDDAPLVEVALKLIGIIDKFEARCAKRSYKTPMSFEKALSLVVSESKNDSAELKKVTAYFISSRIKRKYDAPSSEEEYERWHGDVKLDEKAQKCVEDFLLQAGVWAC